MPDISNFLEFCYMIILEIANKVCINETKRRTDTFQKNCNNVPSESESVYF